jgi:uncharacterized membrane protein (UPF0182 family)
VTTFLVKPNQLDRERPYIADNIQMTRQAYGLDRLRSTSFRRRRRPGPPIRRTTRQRLQNIRLWDVQALKDTLRQVQEIRTYYDFPDIDIDRYQIGGSLREVMLATRELNVDKLPESSRNWINDKLIYTHGYGITMNPVNGFTPEGLPTLLLSNMPVQSTVPGINVTRPEIYFGEMTNTDVYVKTGQQEFNYPEGQTNNLTSYKGDGGIVVGGFLRRILLAFDRGDLAKLPFSDDVTADSRLLMRRNIRDRVAALAPFLTFDQDPYIVVGDDGRLSWMMDGFTSSDSYPYSATLYPGRAGDQLPAQQREGGGGCLRRNHDVLCIRQPGPDHRSVAQDFSGVVQRRGGDALVAAQACALSRADAEPAGRGLWALPHDQSGSVLQPRGFVDGGDAGGNGRRGEQTTEAMEPNFVLMNLPGESGLEFVEILPFTPANRNNMIGWIAARSDGEHYGTAVVYDFPKTRLVDGPQQIEARIDQNAQLSGQLTLWNQQGSHVRRGSLLVIPCGKALLYAEPIYLQAQRSPMPELRLVVLALAGPAGLRAELSKERWLRCLETRARH